MAEADAVVVEVGNEELEHGRVRAELHGDGLLLVQRYGGGANEPAHFEQRVDPSTVQHAISLALDLSKLAGASAGRHTPVPDEPRYRFALRRAGAEPLTIEVWRGELPPEAQKRLREVGQAVQRATDGQAVL